MVPYRELCYPQLKEVFYPISFLFKNVHNNTGYNVSLAYDLKRKHCKFSDLLISLGNNKSLWLFFLYIIKAQQKTFLTSDFRQTWMKSENTTDMYVLIL